MTELIHRCSACDVSLKVEELEQGTKQCYPCEYYWTKKRLVFLAEKLGLLIEFKETVIE